MGRARPPVLVTRRLPREALDRIEARCDMTLYDGEGAMPRDQLLTEVARKAGAITLLTDRVDDEFLNAAGPQLKIVANYAVGFDNIDVEACTRRGVLASNTPEVLTETTADTAFALMMAAARRIAEGDRFDRSGAPWVWGPLMMLGQDVHDATLGIVGFGRIGQALARRGRASPLGSRSATCTTTCPGRPPRWSASSVPMIETWTIFCTSPTSSPCTPASPRRRAI